MPLTSSGIVCNSLSFALKPYPHVVLVVELSRDPFVCACVCVHGFKSVFVCVCVCVCVSECVRVLPTSLRE